MKLIKATNKKYNKEFVFDLGRSIKGQSHLSFSVYSQNAGMNYYTYQTNKKGYYLSVTPKTINFHNGYTTEEMIMFEGIKTCLKEVKRFSHKSFEDCVTLLDERLLMRLCDQIDVELSSEEASQILNIINEKWSG